MNDRKRKYGIWLHNHTSRDDDEWMYVWAKDSNEARDIAFVKMDKSRFSLGDVDRIPAFRKRHGLYGM